MAFIRQLAYICSLLLFSLAVSAQEKEPADSLIRLLHAEGSAELLEIDGQSYRKVVGPARFLHNNTYLLCDTALWNVDTKVIDAIGNVSIIQEGTVLESDKMVYLIDYDLAQFRGSLVELRDSDHNTLRTNHLDYNTKDSVAVFRQGGAMRDKDGQIIESTDGTYDSKIRKFTFTDNVNMFTDSIFVKTTRLVYESDRNLATFGAGTDAWKDDNMLSADAGWYDRSRELFLFRKDVHVMTDTQEGWSDSLYFHRNPMKVEMLGNVQVTDTSRNVTALAGRIMYVDTLSKVTMTRRPAVVSEIREGETVDTVFFGADTLIYYTKRRCDVDSVFVADAEKRLADLDVDPVSTYRRKSAEEAAKAAAEAAKNDPNYRPSASRKQGTASGNAGEPKPPVKDAALRENAAKPDSPAVPDTLQNVPDSLAAVRDSLGLAVDSTTMLPDSLGFNADSLAAAAEPVEIIPPDTTKVGFMTALSNVKVYRKNMQVVCDSLEYSDIDSLARLFRNPAIWNEVKHQYVADSITAVIRNGAMQKASLMSEAFIHIQEDAVHYDQIKSTEMIAYFDADGGLERFDALGGAMALFYIEEQGVLATVNRKDAKMLSAVFQDGQIHKIYYFDTVKSDAYPVVQMSGDEQKLKGFSWTPERRPADRYAVTPLMLRPVERARYASRPRASYRQTDLYFPGYIDDIYLQIAVRDSLSKVRAEERRLEEIEMQRVEKLRADSLAIARDIAVKDSLATEKRIKDSIATVESLAAAADSVARADSLAVADSIAAARIPTRKELQEQKKAERRARMDARKKAKEERWARKDEEDRQKAEAKEQKKLAKLRDRKLKTLQQAAEQEAKDNARLEKYKLKYIEKKTRKNKKAI